jgi:predicted acyl esterase
MHTIEQADGMLIEWDAPIPMPDGIVLRADIFRPPGEGRWPVLLSYGPYAKGLAFQEGFSGGWDRLVSVHPDVLDGTSARYANFEVVDPEQWVPDGYAIVRVDARGAGRSPGFLDPKSIQETRDIHDCIEWAAAQPWCSGKVGMTGISYFATNQWYVASMQPPHLAAICAWEGAADYYRDNTHHGGILSQFLTTLYPWAVWRVQHGVGDAGFRSRVTGQTVAGPETLSEDELRSRRIDIERSLLSHPLDDAYYSERSAKWERITVPMLSAGNWGGQGLHPRGNFEGFMRAASTQKWLEVHGLSHWTHFYTAYGLDLQKRFFAHFLKGEDNGWDRQPPVQLQVRHVDRFELRHEADWPIPRTRWTRWHLDGRDGAAPGLCEVPVEAGSTITYDPMGEGVTFLTAPLSAQTEITGPVSARLWVSSASTDADIFLVLRVFRPDGEEVVFQGSNDPHVPVGLGWLRASHRKLDPVLSKPWRPYHTHDQLQPLEPGVPVELEVEIWPTCIVVPAGYRVGLTVRGCDYRWPGPPVRVPGIGYEMSGVGPFLHSHPVDRPPEIFGAPVTLHLDAGHGASILLPIIPPEEKA